MSYNTICYLDANFEKIEPSITITNNIDDSVHLAVRRVSKGDITSYIFIT